MRRIATFLSMAAFGISLAAGAAHADSRDDALDTVRALSRQISTRLANGQLSDGQLWAGVQGLSDAYHRFTLNETEVRSEEKIGAPLFASLRPGQAEPIENTRPGQKATLSAVPRAWFTKTVADSQRALDRVRSLLESDAPPADMLTALQGFDASLNLIDRPPNG